MSLVRRALAHQRIATTNAALALLRAQNAPVVLAILEQRFTGEQRQIPAPELFEQITEDLEALRSEGFDLPRTAQDYIADWRRAGILIRRPSTEAREETFELSPGALAALQFIDALHTPRRTVTESRLATIQSMIAQLVAETDPDITSRLANLEAEKARIEDQMQRLSAGDFDVLDPERATERVDEILNLVTEVPSDFARVRQEIEGLNHDLREKLIDSDDSRSEVLEDIFRGVDILANSDAGRSFYGFYQLLLDPERGLEFEDAVRTITERDFAAQLTPAQLRALRRMLPLLQDRSTEVHQILTSFSRSLRRFVQTQRLAEERRLNRELRAALKEAMQISDIIRPTDEYDVALQMSRLDQIASVSALRLNNPGDYRVAEITETNHTGVVSLAEIQHLARTMDIDMHELESNVNTVIGDHGTASIAEVLEHFPATQGIASVVGLIVLGQEHGTWYRGNTETVCWDDRNAHIDLFIFDERIGQ
ncbi:MAG TPA: DUF3375 domain-containing protein [Enteractinococcus sp.]